MPLQVHDQAKLEQFFSDIAPFEMAYRTASLRLLALQGKSESELHLGRLEVSAFAERQAPREFERPGVYCAEREFSRSEMTPRELVRALLSGSVDIGSRTFAFPTELGGHHMAHLWPFDGSEIDVRTAPGQLRISGATDRYIYSQGNEVARKLRTSAQAYEGLADLCADFGLKFNNGSLYFDFCATRIAEVLDSSILDGTRIAIKMRLAGLLVPSELAIVLIVRHFDGTTSRAPLSADAVHWDRDASNDWIGVLERVDVDIDNITCRLNYGGVVQHSAKLVQPLHRINTLRFVHDLYDSEAKGLSRALKEAKVTQREPQDLERAVTAMLAMRGFALAGLDRIPHLQEAPDILAVDTRGNLLVVECTIDLPSGDDKLNQASRKAAAIRQNLVEHGREDITVIAVLATSRPWADISSYTSEARRQRVLLWGREYLNDLRMNASAPDPNAFLDQLISDLGMLDLLAEAGDLGGS